MCTAERAGGVAVAEEEEEEERCRGGAGTCAGAAMLTGTGMISSPGGPGATPVRPRVARDEPGAGTAPGDRQAVVGTPGGGPAGPGLGYWPRVRARVRAEGESPDWLSSSDDDSSSMTSAGEAAGLERAWRELPR